MRASLSVVLLLAAGCSSSALVPTPPPSILQQYEKYKVVSELKRVIRSSPGSALAELELAAELSPHDAEVLDLWAQYLSREGQREEAEQLLISAQALDPGYAGAWFSLAKLYADEGQMERARQACSVAKQLNPLRAEYRELLLRLTPDLSDKETTAESSNIAAGRDFTTERQKATILRRLTRANSSKDLPAR